MKKKVSIALPTFNGSEFLRQQLDSIFRQTYQPMEVVAVDDCSTDRTVDILAEYSRNFPLRYRVNKSRLGFIKNFEHAISLCRGDYIALADQDDIWVPGKIETLISEIGDRTIVCSDFSLIDEDGVVIAGSFRKKLNVPVPYFNTQFHCEAFINFVQGCTCLFRNDFKDNILPIPLEAISHDWWFGIVATQKKGIAYVDQPLVMYRQHKTNTLGTKKLWSISGKLHYIFSRDRRAIMIKEQTRIKYYIDHHVYSNNEQLMLLCDLSEHYNSIINTRIHIRAFAIALKHRYSLLPNISPLARWIYLFGRLR